MDKPPWKHAIRTVRQKHEFTLCIRLKRGDLKYVDCTLSKEYYQHQIGKHKQVHNMMGILTETLWDRVTLPRKNSLRTFRKWAILDPGINRMRD